MHPLQNFEVGPWRVWADRHELQSGETIVRVQPRLVALLRRLAQSAGQTVTRETLLDEVWQRRMVNDEVLSRAIADLRQALGDDARQPRYLLTVPKLGYRLVAPVRFDAAPEALPATQAAPSTTDSSIVPERTDQRPHLRWLAAATVLGLLAASAYWYALRRGPAMEPALTAQRLALAQPLSSDPGWELAPRVSADGQWLTWATRLPGAQTTRIYLRAAAGQPARDLTDGQHVDLCPLFSPDGSQLYFQRYEGADCTLMRLPLAATEAVAVTACAPVHSCAEFGADGESLLYSAPAREPGGGAGIARWSLAGSQRVDLSTPPSAAGDDLDPIEIGEAVYFVRGDSSDASVMRWQRGHVERLPVAASMVYGLENLGDGRLLLASDLLGFRALIALDPDLGAAELLGARGARYPHRNARGDLVYENASYDANLWRHRQGSSESERLTQSNRYDSYPRLAPGARTLVFQSNREGLEALYLLDLDSGKERKLALAPDERWAHPAWSPDGKELLVTRYADGGTEVWRYALATDHAERIGQLPTGAHDAQYDPDQPHLLWYLLAVDGHLRLHRNGEIQFDMAVAHYLTDPQGVFLATEGKDTLLRCTPECSDLGIRLAAGQSRNWTISDQAVYFVSADQTERVQRLDLKTMQSTDTGWPAPSTLSRAIDVSRDGQLAIIARTDRLDVDVMGLLR